MSEEEQARAAVEWIGLRETPWAVFLLQPDELRFKTLWGHYASRAEAERAVLEAERYLSRDEAN